MQGEEAEQNCPHNYPVAFAFNLSEESGGKDSIILWMSDQDVGLGDKVRNCERHKAVPSSPTAAERETHTYDHRSSTRTRYDAVISQVQAWPSRRS